VPAFLLKVAVCGKKHTVNKMENEIEELDSMDGYKFLDVEEVQNVEHKNVREKLKTMTDVNTNKVEGTE
jgi:cupin superfamily acireductone dioxygenase involved in methionine salvage